VRFASIARNGTPVLALRKGDEYVDLSQAAPQLPRTLRGLLEGGTDALRAAATSVGSAGAAARVNASTATVLPPIGDAQKYICLGLNYVDHAAESPYEKPSYPVLFTRFPTSFVGSGAPLVRSVHSLQFDYEGELVAVIGKTARNVTQSAAHEYVAGYSIFNDGSYRDYQFKTPQWTVGKNFDASGAFGPEFVTADELPAGAAGLRLQTLLNGKVMQDASTADMIFDVATTIATITEVITLLPGDVLVMGTPAGVGFARKPPVWMVPGDRIEVTIEGIGRLSNPVVAEPE
jgi:2-keto-4-pentenoate hydratase/2-oxohepta-3-ene-1,7-dioic acid hydratase in catechol pathway